MIRVLLADDHAIVLEGLRALLEGEPDMKVAAWTTDGTEVVKLVQQHKPDVVVLDLELTSIKGTEVITALRHRPAAPKVLVLTAYNDGESLRSALDAGADGLALKTEPPQQTLTAIRQVHGGQLVFPQAARRWIEGRGAGTPGDLTPREREVWSLVAGGLTNPQIAERRVGKECRSRTTRSSSTCSICFRSWASRTAPRRPSSMRTAPLPPAPCDRPRSGRAPRVEGGYFTVNRTLSTTGGFRGTCFQSATTAITRWGPGFRESSTNSV